MSKYFPELGNGEIVYKAVDWSDFPTARGLNRETHEFSTDIHTNLKAPHGYSKSWGVLTDTFIKTDDEGATFVFPDTARAVYQDTEVWNKLETFIINNREGSVSPCDVHGLRESTSIYIGKFKGGVNYYAVRYEDKPELFGFVFASTLDITKEAGDDDVFSQRCLYPFSAVSDLSEALGKYILTPVITGALPAQNYAENYHGVDGTDVILFKGTSVEDKPAPVWYTLPRDTIRFVFNGTTTNSDVIRYRGVESLPSTSVISSLNAHVAQISVPRVSGLIPTGTKYSGTPKTETDIGETFKLADSAYDTYRDPAVKDKSAKTVAEAINNQLNPTDYTNLFIGLGVLSAIVVSGAATAGVVAYSSGGKKKKKMRTR